MKTFLKSLISFMVFSNLLLADDSTIKLNKDSSKLQFIISGDLPKGSYQIWDLTLNKKVGESVNKDANDESFGSIQLPKEQANNKFVILDPEGEVVATHTGENVKKVIDPKLDPRGIGEIMKGQRTLVKKDTSKEVRPEAKGLANNYVTTTASDDQVEYLDKLIVAQKAQLSALERLSRSSKMKIQRMLKKKKSFDCQKELDSNSKTTPEIEAFCKSARDTALAYEKAEAQLKKTSAIKLDIVKTSEKDSQKVANVAQVLEKNYALPTNLDPKSLQIPAETKTNPSMTEAPTGSWGKPLRFYEVMEYCHCLCGSAGAQIVGRTCPAGSSILSCHDGGPYTLNNGGITCDLNSSPPVMKFVQDTYTPSTLTSGVKAIHGDGVVAQVRALRESGEINKLSGPEVMEFLVELEYILSATPSFRAGEPIKAEMAPLRELWEKYVKEQEALQVKNREAKNNIPPKIYGTLNFKFLNLELLENRAPMNSLAVIPITEPVSLEGGTAEVRLIGGFWGQHGWEVSTDKKNFSKIETPVTIKNGDVVYLRGQTVKAYNHAIGIEILFSATKVNGHDYGYREFIFPKTENGCNSDGLVQWDYQFNLAPHIFPNGQNERCFTLDSVYGDKEPGSEIWKFGQGIVASLPQRQLGEEVTLNCTDINHLAGKTTLYKLPPYKNPFNGNTQDYFPVRDCKVSGTIKFVCDPKQGWKPAQDPGVCRLE